MKKSKPVEPNITYPRLSLRYNERKDVFIVRMGSVSALISGNLIRHRLGIPYTKKDGSFVSKSQIEDSKRKARRAYAEAMVSKLNL